MDKDKRWIKDISDGFVATFVAATSALLLKSKNYNISDHEMKCLLQLTCKRCVALLPLW